MISSYDFTQSHKTLLFENIYKSIFELLSESTESNINLMESYIDGRYQRPQTLFKTLLNDPRLNKNDFFITLNYDLYIDREVYAFQNKINYGIPKKFINQSNMRITRDTNFSIYHLHGSLNWENISNNIINIRIGAVLPKQNEHGPNICLIPPGKKELNPILKLVWNTCEKRLLKADELILIGCSLNKDDTELINLLSNYIENNKSETIKNIYLDPKNDPATSRRLSVYYKKILGGGIKEYPYGFTLTEPRHKSNAIEFIFS